MNQLDHWLLPDGVEDLLPPTAGKLEAARQTLIRVFTSWGFDYVMPPKLEFIDSLLTGTGKDLDLQTIKVIDQLSGRLMGLPADITPKLLESTRTVCRARALIGSVMRVVWSGAARKVSLEHGCPSKRAPNCLVIAPSKPILRS